MPNAKWFGAVLGLTLLAASSTLVHAQYKDKKEPIQKDRAAVGDSGELLDGRADRDRGDRQITGMDKGGKDKQPSKGKDTKDKSYISRP
jgi:hypothetical protein